MSEKKLLGDRVEEAVKPIAEALGIEGCTGCQKRKEALNKFDKGRRSFLTKCGVASAYMTLKTKTLEAAWQAVGATPPLAPVDAVPLVRMITQVNHHHRISQGLELGQGGFIKRGQIIAYVVSHMANSGIDINSPYYAWVRKLQPNFTRVLPGWALSYWTDGVSYRTVLAGPTQTWISDELGVIYYAPTPSVVPDASTLSSASEFPNATALGAVPSAKQEPPTLWERVRSYFTPVYAQGGCATCNRNTCDYPNGSCCNWCLVTCTYCSSGECLSTVPPKCNCWFNPGCQGCPYFGLGCIGASNCNKCATELFGVGCCCGCCTPTCCGGGAPTS